jgi:Zn-dependent protease with chaperone function
MSSWIGRRAVGYWVAALWVALGAAPGRSLAQEPADLYLRLDARGDAEVVLTLDSEPSASAPLVEDVGQALGGTLRDVETSTDEEEWTLQAWSDGAFRRRGLQVEGTIDPAPLLSRLRSLGVSGLTIDLTRPHVGFAGSMPGAESVTVHRSHVHHAYSIYGDTTSRPIQFAFGYTYKHLLRTAAPLLALLLLPVVLTLRRRRAALRATHRDPTAVWFGYWRFLQGMTLGTIAAWAAAAYALRVYPLADFILGGRTQAFEMPLGFALFLLPPLLVTTLCSILSQPVYERVRGMGWTRDDLARQAVTSLMAGILPVMLLLAALNALLANEPRWSAICFVAALLLYTVFQGRLQKAMSMEPIALTVGELRDRVFALAEQAGVKVQQVYVIPSGKGRMANAFAVQGNNLLLTDYLLQHLNRREVDAILAHELAHLQRRDPRRLWTTLLLTAGAAGIVVGVLSALDLVSEEQSPFAVGTAVAVALLMFFFSSRRFEGKADAGAVELTGDPEALITALAKVMRLNLLPLHWGKWDERTLTHPSTLRRVQAIAAQSGVPPERLEEILSAPQADDEQYPLPEAVTAEEVVFSTPVKTRILVRLWWSLAAVMVLPPALVASLARAGSLEGGARWAVSLGGLLATLVLYLAALNVAPLWGYDNLRRRLRHKLEREGTASLRAPGAAAVGLFVALAPAAAPRLYENFYDWDVGFLFLGGNRLCYVGEQTRFALHAEQVTEIRLGPGGPGWWRAPRVYITWRDEERGAGGTFNLRPAAARSMRELAREARGLEKQLQAWREGSSAPRPLPEPLSGLEPPEIGAVTSLSPRTLASGRGLAGNLFLLSLLAAGAAALFALPFDPFEGGDGWYPVLVAMVVAFFQWWPYRRYRDPATEESGDPASVKEPS